MWRDMWRDMDIWKRLESKSSNGIPDLGNLCFHHRNGNALFAGYLDAVVSREVENGIRDRIVCNGLRGKLVKRF
jgi:hypothetical protein